MSSGRRSIEILIHHSPAQSKKCAASHLYGEVLRILLCIHKRQILREHHIRPLPTATRELRLDLYKPRGFHGYVHIPIPPNAACRCRHRKWLCDMFCDFPCRRFRRGIRSDLYQTRDKPVLVNCVIRFRGADRQGQSVWLAIGEDGDERREIEEVCR